MLQMFLLENNNDVYEDMPSCKYRPGRGYSFTNISAVILSEKCETCHAKSEEEKVVLDKVTDRISGGYERVLHCVVLVTICFLVYANTLHGDFVHDDISAIVTNQDALGTSSIFSVFCNDFWGMHIRDRRSHKSYRPVTILTFRLGTFFLLC